MPAPPHAGRQHPANHRAGLRARRTSGLAGAQSRAEARADRRSTSTPTTSWNHRTGGSSASASTHPQLPARPPRTPSILVGARAGGAGPPAMRPGRARRRPVPRKARKPNGSNSWLSLLPPLVQCRFGRQLQLARAAAGMPTGPERISSAEAKVAWLAKVALADDECFGLCAALSWDREPPLKLPDCGVQVPVRLAASIRCAGDRAWR